MSMFYLFFRIEKKRVLLDVRKKYVGNRVLRIDCTTYIPGTVMLHFVSVFIT